ncbi:MAG: hypothetical protein V7L20_00485 [Nostoc sp.]|uniref:hypothetical protein n=1 Tax=Nostoc sp. TaxID=1180 RepID=UPI002FF773C4
MMTKEIILLHQESKANYEVTVNLVAEYDHALNIKIIIEEEIQKSEWAKRPATANRSKAKDSKAPVIIKMLADLL